MFTGTFARLRRRRTVLCRSTLPTLQALESRRLLTVTPNPGGAPNAPFDLVATASGPDTVTFSFIDSADNETGFVVQRSDNGGPFTHSVTLGPSPGVNQTLSFTYSALTAGTTYAFEVTAFNGPYASSTPAAVSVTTPNPNAGGAPNAPFALAAKPDTAGHGITFSFYDSADNETGFIVYRATSAGGPFSQVAALGPSTAAFQQVSYDDTLTNPGTTYFYTAVAKNGPYVSSTPTAVSATAPGASTGGGIALDQTFANGGDFRDAGAGAAVRVAASPDGRVVYTLSSNVLGNNGGYTGPIIDVNDAVTGGTFGHFSINRQLQVPFSSVTGLAVQSDGKLIVAGNGGGNIVVARFNADGTPDTSFGNAAGELVVNFAGNEQVADVAVAPNGKIYVGGSHGIYLTPLNEFFAVRLNSDGSLDRTFGFNGISKGHVIGKGGGGAAAIAVDPTDGSVIVVGFSQANVAGVDKPNALDGTRLLPSGVGTNDFEYDAGTGGSGADDVIVQADRKIVVVGQNQFAAEALRLNPDGTKDPTWVGPGAITTPGQSNPNASFNGVARLADGSYVIVGQRTAGAQTGALVARLNAADGSISNNGAALLIRGLPDNAGSENASYADVTVSSVNGAVFAAGQDHAILLTSKYAAT